MRPQTLDVPLFPLPRGALLPGEFLPLHIFEPRYRQMMRSVRRGGRAIAIGTLEPGWQADEQGRPFVADIVGLGRLFRDELKDDGTSDIVLHGWGRARILAELPSDPFRLVRVELLDDGQLHAVLAFRLRRQLLVGLSDRLGGDLSYDVTARFDAGALADRIASALELPPATRVSMMQAVVPEQRIHHLLGLLDEPRHQRRFIELVPSLADFTLSFPDGTDTAR